MVSPEARVNSATRRDGACGTSGAIRRAARFRGAHCSRRWLRRGLALLGPAGGTFEYDLQRYLRDVLVLTIGGGTSQIQKNIIAKVLGL